MAKIISFYKNQEDYFIKVKPLPLTGSMVKTLRLACYKQNHHILFGPADIDGSSTALINRGLLKAREVLKNGNWQLTWYVTERAMQLLAEVKMGKRINSASDLCLSNFRIISWFSRGSV